MLLVRRFSAWVIAAGFLFAGLAPASAVVEYVKVCSLYGAGFFYIPGTDTCIKVGGFYVGGSLGGRSTGDDVTNEQQLTFSSPDPRPNPTASVNSTGVYGNIFTGYNYVSTTFIPNLPIVIGVEGFVGTGSNKATITGIPGTGAIATQAVMANDSTTVDMGYNAGILGRLGTIVPMFGRFPVMVSLVGGVGFQRVEMNFNCTTAGACGTNFIPAQMFPFNKTLTGSLIGFELEAPLPVAPSRGFSANVRFQYLHGDFGNFSDVVGNPALIQFTANQRITTDQFTGGFVAHIDWGDGTPGRR